MAKVENQRGLKNYIQEIRNCNTKDAEHERVQKELGKIRKKYTSNKPLSSYDKRKYLWKLMYTKMLGYDVEFGHKQAMDMMAATTYAEKQVGYVVCGMFLSENDELLRLVINSVRSDLLSRNEAFQCLALDFTANVGGPEFAQLLAADVLNVMAHGATRPIVRKKAALCLLRLLRKSPDDQLLSAKDWGSKMAALLEETDLGVLLGLTTLLLGIVSRNYEGYEACIPRLVEILERLREKDVPQDYTYYGLPSPWLEVKVLRALQYFPAPENPEMLKRLRAILKQILSVNDPVKNPNKNNAAHAIVFEAAAVAVSIEDEELTPLVVNLMVRFLTVRESNLKYLALENINRLSQSWQISKAISQHRKTIIACMSDADSSITGVALNLLFTTANKDTAGEIVEELLTAIERSDYSMREELVLKAAILAERFPPSPEWYVNVMLRLILCAGDASSNEIWHSILHLVSAKKELQAHAVEKVTKILQEDVANEVFLQCAAYIVGEYGRQSSMETMEQFNLLHQYYHSLSPEAKAMFLNCYEKMRCRSDADSELAKKIDDLMAYESKSIDPEVQQRAVEYSSLCSNHNIAEIALQTLPPWEMKKSVLLRKLVGNEGTSEEAREQPAWLDSSKEPNFDTEPPEPSEITDVHVDSTAAINDDSKEVSMEPQQPVQVLDLLDFGNDEPSEVPDEAINGSSIIEETQATVAEEVRQTSKTEPIEDIDAWLASLYTSMSGILYEDSNMQIGLKIRGKMSNLEIDFFVGNKTEGTLELKKFTIPPTPYFEVNCTEAPAEIEKGQQIMLQSTWACLLPYNTLPVLQIQYLTSGGESMARSLKLPTPVTKFCSPVTIPANVFITRWNQVSGAPFKLGKKKQCQSNPTAEQIAQILTMLNFEIIQVDLGQPNTSAVCIFHCESGQVKQIPCMASITASDVDPSEMTVTVATADATISEALMHALYTCLD
ncbi:hypothetical protein M9435_006465 [Picochlorum sp. BPE23]|nr:hypothetical protein M9435_006465 [Picochlorum sp. BPE23]